MDQTIITRAAAEVAKDSEAAIEAVVSIAIQELWLLAALVLLATVTGGARAFRDSDYSSTGNLIALSVTTGSVALGFCSLYGHVAGGLINNWLPLVFVSVASGVVGKPLEQLMRRRLAKLMGMDDER